MPTRSLLDPLIPETRDVTVKDVVMSVSHAGLLAPAPAPAPCVRAKVCLWPGAGC